MLKTVEQPKTVKSADDYVEEIMMWCAVINQCSKPASDPGLSESEIKARDNAIMALHLTTKEYIDQSDFHNL